ncbi:MAG: deoxynucleoside kinase [FCB group bacterium]|nr:deoxynucleoside kinase [FCB group bacterium]
MDQPYYIAVEGVIGAGKTSLAERLAERLHALLVLEQPDENPFLTDFYKDRAKYAFQTQLFFLLSRYKQQEEFPQPDLFHKKVISDYIFHKDRIFASLNLDAREYRLYEKIVEIMEPRIPKPDLVVYLQSSPNRLVKNIRIRNRSYEKSITEDYIDELNEAYNRFFFSYRSTPLLVVNSEKIDFVKNEEHFEELLRAILGPGQGTRYYNPIV